MEFKYHTFYGIYLTTVALPFVIGQKLTGETLIKESFCDLSNINISCSSNSIIALENVQLGYNGSRCSQSCCNLHTDDCIVNSTDIQDVKRSCSGYSTCSPSLSSNVQFCDFGQQPASYLYFEYFCIPNSRRTSVCSGTVINSTTGETLYLTNEGFPGVTVGDDSCSCSFEAESCSSNTSSFIIDADLYQDTGNCSQEITFRDSNSSTLGNVGCESYFDNYITQKQFKTNYIQIYFNNNSTQNREGIFIIGFQATQPNVTIRISCPTAQPTWCIDCGTPNKPTDGDVILDGPSNTGYSATASVTCKPGFNASTTTITCKERGIWQEALCTPIDCEPLPTIENGNIQLDVPGNKSFGASATVTCDDGYAANTSRVSCTVAGTWKAAACVSSNCTDSEWQCASGVCISSTERCDNNSDCVDNSDEFNCTGAEICNKGQIMCSFSNASHICKPGGEVCDCGTLTIVNGNVTLSQPGNTSSEATATLVCNKGYNASATTVTCGSDGLWTTANCTLKDCGDLPDVPMANVTLTSAGIKTYGATATVACATGYKSSKAVISCLENATWETATCVIKDCGDLPDVRMANVTLTTAGNKTYGATATVACLTGYNSSKTVISCLENATWETAICVIKAEPMVVIPPKEDKSVIAIVIVVVVLIGLALLQVTFYVVLHLKIYQQYTEPGEKHAKIIALSAIPLLGIIVIAKRWKALQYGKYKVPHPEHPEDERLHRSSLSTENGRPISAGSGNEANQREESAVSSGVHRDQLELKEKSREGTENINNQSDDEQTDSEEEEVVREKEKQTEGTKAINMGAEGEQPVADDDDVEKEKENSKERTENINSQSGDEQTDSGEEEVGREKEKQTEGTKALNMESEGEQTDSEDDEVEKEPVKQLEETDAIQIKKKEQSCSDEHEAKANEDQKPTAK